MTETFNNPPRYQTDFNDVEDDGLLTTLPGWGGSMLLPADMTTVELFDGDGNSCLGIVDHVVLENGLIFVTPIWDTWHDVVVSTLPSIDDALLIQAMTKTAEGQRTGSEPDPVKTPA